MGTRKSFAFNADKPGVLDASEAIFRSSLKKVDVTFQNLDSSEISLSDVSHYFDSDPTKVVSGLRTDGKKPTAFVADTTTANAQVRTLSETVRLDSRTKLLNPKFYEGMLKSGYEGTREITKRLRNTAGPGLVGFDQGRGLGPGPPLQQEQHPQQEQHNFKWAGVLWTRGVAGRLPPPHQHRALSPEMLLLLGTKHCRS